MSIFEGFNNLLDGPTPSETLWRSAIFLAVVLALIFGACAI